MLSRLSSPSPLVGLGAVVLLVGAAADLAFHLFGAAPLTRFGLLVVVGDDGYRAHLITFAGMLISVTGLVVRAVHTR